MRSSRRCSARRREIPRAPEPLPPPPDLLPLPATLAAGALSAMVIQQSDLPDGMQLQEHGTTGNEPANGLTHLAGVLLAIAAFVALVWVGVHTGNILALISG